MIETSSNRKECPNAQLNFLQELLTIVLGVIMFLASGSVVIHVYRRSSAAAALISAGRAFIDAGLALGSMCIITAAVMFVDLVFLAKKVKK